MHSIIPYSQYRLACMLHCPALYYSIMHTSTSRQYPACIDSRPAYMLVQQYYSYTRFCWQVIGDQQLAGSNKSSHYDHRLILCAVGTLLARGAGLALRPHRDRKCRSTDRIMCAVGHLLVHESSKCRSTEIISCAVVLLLVHESRKSRSTEKIQKVLPPYRAIWYAKPLRKEEKLLRCCDNT